MKQLITLMKKYEELTGHKLSIAFDSNEMGCIQNIVTGAEWTFYNLKDAAHRLKSMIFAVKALPKNAA